MIDLVVRGDTVVTPQGVGAYDIAIEGERIVPRQQRCLRMNRWHVCKRAYTARLALVEVQNTGRVWCRQKHVRRAGGARTPTCAMITASVVRVLQRYTDALYTHSLLIFQ